MKSVDLEQWPRREHFQFFAGLTFPFYNVTVPLDVTALRNKVKAEGLSFYYALVYAVTTVMNGIEDFRYKIRKDGVVLVDRLHPSFVTLDRVTHLFKIVNTTLPAGVGLPEFCALADRADKEQIGLLPTAESEAQGDFIYISCTPWFSFTAMSHEMNCDPDDSTPRVSWGKYEERDGRVTLPLNVQFNHRLLDGYHLHLLLDGLEEFFAGL